MTAPLYSCCSLSHSSSLSAEDISITWTFCAAKTLRKVHLWSLQQSPVSVLRPLLSWLLLASPGRSPGSYPVLLEQAQSRGLTKCSEGRWSCQGRVDEPCTLLLPHEEGSGSVSGAILALPSQQSWDQAEPLLERSPGIRKSGSWSLGKVAGLLSSPPEHVCEFRYFQSLLENAAAGCSLPGSTQMVSSSASGWADLGCPDSRRAVSPSPACLSPWALPGGSAGRCRHIPDAERGRGAQRAGGRWSWCSALRSLRGAAGRGAQQGAASERLGAGRARSLPGPFGRAWPCLAQRDPAGLLPRL